MRKLAIIGAALALGACSTIKSDAAAVADFFAKAQARVQMTAAEVQADLPAVCSGITLWDSALRGGDALFQLAVMQGKVDAKGIAIEKEVMAAEGAAMTAIAPLCAPGYQVTNPGADIQLLVAAYKAVKATLPQATAAAPAS